MSRNARCESFRIAAQHPALPGHFPGDPIVPGVILLDHVAAAIGRAWGLRVAALLQVKFIRPLRPRDEVRLELERETGRVRFRIDSGGETIARGVLEVAP